MNTKSYNLEEVQNKFQSLMTETSKEEGINHDAFILMAGYLSEIERVQKLKGVNRKQLAKEVQTSASYLTQVFRGDKPLNFHTIAKIQRALQIRFTVTATLAGQNSISLTAQRVKRKTEHIPALRLNFLHCIKGGNFGNKEKSAETKKLMISNA